MNGGLVPVEREHLMGVCKPGQGPACCRYLVMAAGFSCAKESSLGATLHARAEAGTLSARGDNCSGPPGFEVADNLNEGGT